MINFFLNICPFALVDPLPFILVAKCVGLTGDEKRDHRNENNGGDKPLQ